MNTHKLCIAAVVGLSGLTTMRAQTNYSVNGNGYINVVVPAHRFALLANQLNKPTNSLATVLPAVPANTTVYVLNSGTGAFDTAIKLPDGSWSGTAANATLEPGAGFFLKNDGAVDLSITLTGAVPVGTNLTVRVPAGWSLLSSIIPQAGSLERDLKFPAAVGDQFFLFDTASQFYLPAYTRRLGGWTGGVGNGEPVIMPTQAFFYKAVSPTNWTRSFLLTP